MPNDTLTPDRQLDTALERAPVPSQWLCCAACEQRIALREDAVSFDGGHQHRFLNPQRRAFRIALYARAPGCGHVGEDSEYFSWFPGYSWRVAVCGSCGEQLGWAFSCVGPPGVGEPTGFHGLIPERLRRC